MSDQDKDALAQQAEQREQDLLEANQSLRDMLDDARADLAAVRQALGVHYEPHQSLQERTLLAAQQAEREPLAKRAILDLVPTTMQTANDIDLLWFARAVERAHRIGDPHHPAQAGQAPAVGDGPLTEEDITRALNFAYQFRSHPASRSIDEIEQAGELILLLLSAPQAEREPLGQAPAVGDEQPAPSPTAGMTLAQRILHVGGRNNAAGYVEFGSTQAVEALIRQVLRDLPRQAKLTGTPPRAEYVKAARAYALAYGLRDDSPAYLPRTQAEADAFEPHAWVIGAMMQAFGDGWADGHAAGIEFMKEAAAIRHADLAAQQSNQTTAVGDGQWVPVSERLPDRNVEVLVAFGGISIPATGQYTGSSKDRDPNGWCYPAENNGTCDDGSDPVVTHWMPLPDPPKSNVPVADGKEQP